MLQSNSVSSTFGSERFQYLARQAWRRLSVAHNGCNDCNCCNVTTVMAVMAVVPVMTVMTVVIAMVVMANIRRSLKLRPSQDPPTPQDGADWTRRMKQVMLFAGGAM